MDIEPLARRGYGILYVSWAFPWRDDQAQMMHAMGELYYDDGFSADRYMTGVPNGEPWQSFGWE